LDEKLSGTRRTGTERHEGNINGKHFISVEFNYGMEDSV
jgi:hypothetical protein